MMVEKTVLEEECSQISNQDVNFFSPDDKPGRDIALYRLADREKVGIMTTTKFRQICKSHLMLQHVSCLVFI